MLLSCSYGSNSYFLRKVRCEFSPDETRCQRCIAGDHECLARERKKRKPAPYVSDTQGSIHVDNLTDGRSQQHT